MATKGTLGAIVGDTNSQAEDTATAEHSDDSTVNTNNEEDALVESDSDGMSASNELGRDSGDDSNPPELKVIFPVQKTPLASNRPRPLTSSVGTNPFFDNGSPSKSTVFVIDKSGSMGHRNRLERVMVSLIDAIHNLEPSQEFNVVLFDTVAYSFTTDGLVIAATNENKKEVESFLREITVGDGTYPLEALRTALQVRPERIVMLSDGEFDPTVVDLISIENQLHTEMVRIDCVGLDETVLVLQKLARDNKGTYYQAK